MKYYAIVGRIPFDEEDSCFTMQASSLDEAIEIFEKEITSAAGYASPDAYREDRQDVDGEIYINHTLESDSPIT